MRILRLSTLSLTLAIAVFALGYANPSFAAPLCSNNPTHPRCVPDGGGTADLDYEAGLNTGVFKFPAVKVTPNAKENALIPDPDNDDLEFFRPGAAVGVPYTGLCSLLTEPTQTECNDWDAVIQSCDHLVDTGLFGKDVPTFTVTPDDLGFDAAGGGWVSIGGIDVFDDMGLFMHLNLSLIGDCFDECTDDFVPDSGNPKTIPLSTVWVTGHTVEKGKKGHCNKDGHRVTLDIQNDLVITATAP